MFRHVLVSALVVCAAGAPAFADDWVVYKLRGGVFAFEQQRWVQLRLDDVVPDRTVIRTQKGGRVQFVRGMEMVELGPETQVEIVDEDGRQFTTVKQWYGEVAVDAEARNVQHFAVKTPDLAAVVKGTLFKVGANGGSSEVTVMRGHVAVEDVRTHDSVTITVGQTVSTGAGELMQVSGSGQLPAVVDAGGNPVVAPVVVVPERTKEFPTISEDSSVSATFGDGSSSAGSESSGWSGPGNSGNAPGHDSNGPGNSENAPGHGGDNPGEGHGKGNGGDS